MKHCTQILALIMINILVTNRVSAQDLQPLHHDQDVEISISPNLNLIQIDGEINTNGTVKDSQNPAGRPESLPERFNQMKFYKNRVLDDGTIEYVPRNSNINDPNSPFFHYQRLVYDSVNQCIRLEVNTGIKKDHCMSKDPEFISQSSLRRLNSDPNMALIDSIYQGAAEYCFPVL